MSSGAALGMFHTIQVSATHQDSTSQETVTHRYKANGNLRLPTVGTKFHDTLSEGGRSSHVAEAVGVPISAGGNTFEFPAYAYQDTLAHMVYLAAHPGAAVNAAVVGATAAYVHEWEWPGSTTNAEKFRAVTLETLGIPGTSDDNQNRDHHAAIASQVQISFSQDNPVTVSTTFTLGGKHEDGGSGTGSLTVDTTRMFNWSHVNCHLSTTAGFAGGSPTYDWVNDFVLGTDSQLAGTPADKSAYLRSGTITFTRTPDYAASLQAGVADSNGASVVEDGDNWCLSNNGVSASIELVFTSAKTADDSVLADLPRDMEAGTQRGVEILIEEDTASISSAMLGGLFTFGRCQITEAEEQDNGGGPKTLRTVWVPQYDSTLGNAAFISLASKISANLGA